MKKTLAYAVTAILLGFAIMQVPLALQTGQLQPFFNAPTEGRDTKAADISQYNLLAAPPSNLLSSSLILLSGLIAALAAYALLKKRISRQPTLP